jgi:hypothetical protein
MNKKKIKENMNTLKINNIELVSENGFELL